MRLFLLICALATGTHAMPDGYKYGVGTENGAVTNTRHSASDRSSNSLGFGSSLSSTGHLSSLFTSELGRTFFQSGDNVNNARLTGSFQNGGQGVLEAPIVHKQFISIAAPENNELLERRKHLVLGRPQKNYRVIFIKAPSSINSNVKLSAEYAPKEEQTVIYVLSKNDASLEVNDIATPAPSVPTKPEIVFLKYKTDAEAQQAQQRIQEEYNKIGGTSEHTDAGIGPVHSVVGIAGDDNGREYDAASEKRTALNSHKLTAIVATNGNHIASAVAATAANKGKTTQHQSNH